LETVLVGKLPSIWSARHVAAIAEQPMPALPLITAGDAVPILPGFDLWDLWPLQNLDGSTVSLDGWTMWMILSAPCLPDPGDRHDIARIRLIIQKGVEWRDCGNLLPDGLCPGSREWAGSALYDPQSGQVTLFYTASGRRGEAKPTFEQRLFQTSGTLWFEDGHAQIVDWTLPIESVQSDDDHYVRVNQEEGVPGMIKGFRDPAHFRDPADGQDYLLFTGSLKHSTHSHNGVIGLVRANGSGHSDWDIMPPVISADGLNNEQERPHVIFREGLYYLFWSTQRRVFAPDGPSGPTGLYAMVASSMFGPWEPVNGTGLVVGNPDAEPNQTYSWWVLDSLEVVSFVDHWGLKGRTIADHPDLNRSQFGGTPAPVFRIALDGTSIHLLVPAA
jgi:levansucrase